MNYGVVIVQIVILFALIAVGFVCGKTGVIRDEASADLTNLLFKVALPATLFSAMIREFETDLIRDALWCVLIAALFFGSALWISWLLSGRMGLKDGKRSIWTIAATFSNTGFVGFPVIQALYGAEGLFLAAMINMVFNMMVYTIGVKLVMDENQGTARTPLRKMLLSNINIATAAGVIFFVFRIPVHSAVMSVINSLGAMTTPLSMLITGLNMARGNVAETVKDKDVVTASAMRLLIMPLAAAGIAALIPFRDGSLIPGVFTMIIAMPAPTVCVLLAEQYDGNRLYGSRVVVLTSLACMVTIPLIALLL